MHPQLVEEGVVEDKQKHPLQEEQEVPLEEPRRPWRQQELQQLPPLQLVVQRATEASLQLQL